MIFELLIWTCIENHQMVDDSYIKSCRWHSRGYYANEMKCASDGQASLGQKVHQFEIIIGSDRTAEKFRCSVVPVKQ
jgi:hypothetical protein